MIDPYEQFRNQARMQTGVPPYAAPPYRGVAPEPTNRKDGTMTMKIDMGWIIVLAYVLGGFGSFGYVYNHSKGNDQCYVTNGVQHDCFTDNNSRAFYAGMFGVIWPIYWGGIVALNTTK